MELIFLLPFVNNLLMALLKWLFSDSFRAVATRNVRLRLLLTGLSFGGVLAGWALKGDPIDPNVVSDLAAFLIESALVFGASHFSYKAIKS